MRGTVYLKQAPGHRKLSWIAAIVVFHPLPPRYNPPRAGIAQLVEQLICNQKVVGSIPIAGTNKTRG